MTKNEPDPFDYQFMAVVILVCLIGFTVGLLFVP